MSSSSSSSSSSSDSSSSDGISSSSSSSSSKSIFAYSHCFKSKPATYKENKKSTKYPQQ